MDNSVNMMIKILHEKYGKSVLSKTELAKELGVSTATLTTRIQQGIDIPDYIKNGKAKNASVTFPILDVAKYLCRTIKVA